MPSRNRSREAAKARQRAELQAKGLDPGSPEKNRRKQKRKPKRPGPTTKAAGQSADQSPKPANKTGAGGRRPRTGPMLDPSAHEDAEVRFVMPGDAVKVYLCPGCNRDIAPGVGHIVAVPPDEPDLRRHWHRGCWEHRRTRF